MFFKSVFFEFVNNCAGQPSTDVEFKKQFKQLHVDLIHITVLFMVGHFALKEAKKRYSLYCNFSQFNLNKILKKLLNLKQLTGMLLSYIHGSF